MDGRTTEAGSGQAEAVAVTKVETRNSKSGTRRQPVLKSKELCGTDGFLDKFCEAAGIGVEWELSELVWKAAGHAYQNHATPRKRQTDQAPRRILADFLIGAHALVNGYRLLTLDAGTYRLSFPKLQLAEI